MMQYWQSLLAKFHNPWQFVGILGNFVFASRFIVQWIASERARKSVIPVLFWHLSIIGTVIMLAFGFAIREPVVILGYLFNLFVYLRNLWFIYGWGKKEPVNA